MKGTHTIQVSNKRVRYEFTINRNITIIQGDSATGKTTLISLIRDYGKEGVNSGVKLHCDKPCIVLQSEMWQEKLENTTDSIVFIDEGNRFISSVDFARAVQNSDNYYVIITREDLHALPYSIQEIYGIKTVGKTKTSDPTYNEMYRLYGEYATNSIIKPTKIITEDSNAGYDFFENIGEMRGIKCISAKGKNEIINYINEEDQETVLIVADGAAFGSEMGRIMQHIKYFPNYVIYLPESFEWLILKSGIFKDTELTNILDNPSQYIESSKFVSWERFFTHLLETITGKTSLVPKYNKTGKLTSYYKNAGNSEKILNQIEKIQF